MSKNLVYKQRRVSNVLNHQVNSIIYKPVNKLVREMQNRRNRFNPFNTNVMLRLLQLKQPFLRHNWRWR